MGDVKPTPEEQELLTSVENDEWLSIPNLEEEIKRYQSYAKAHLGQGKRKKTIEKMCYVARPAARTVSM